MPNPAAGMAAIVLGRVRPRVGQAAEAEMSNPYEELALGLAAVIESQQRFSDAAASNHSSQQNNLASLYAQQNNLASPYAQQNNLANLQFRANDTYNNLANAAAPFADPLPKKRMRVCRNCGFTREAYSADTNLSPETCGVCDP